MKSQVSEVLNDVFAEIAKNPHVQRKITEFLYENHKIPHGTFQEIVVNNERFFNLSEIEQVVVVNAIYQITNFDQIEPTKFYTNKEIKATENYIYGAEDRIELPYTFEGVLKAGPYDYLTVVSYKDLAKLWNSGILTYNFQTQRLSKKKINSKGEVVERPDVNKKSVKNIVRLMREGKYSPSTILLNVLVDGKSHIEYEDGNLTIGEGSTVNLIDGMHRIQAILEVIEEEPEFEGYMNVDIKHYPIEKAQQLLAITNTVNKFDKTLVKHYMAESYGAQIAKDLMNIPELKNRISIKTALDKKLKLLLTNFAILSESIEDIFEPKNAKDRFDHFEVLKKFYSYFVTAYQEKLLDNKDEVSKTSWFPHHNLHVGFIVIAKKLYDKYGKDFPVDEIVRIIDNIDFNKETSYLTEIMSGQGKVNSNRVKKEIKKYFEEKVDELLK
jgi:hypothetical protein